MTNSMRKAVYVLGLLVVAARAEAAPAPAPTFESAAVQVATATAKSRTAGVDRADETPSLAVLREWNDALPIIRLAAAGDNCTCVQYRYETPIKVCVRWVKGVCVEYVTEVPKVCVRQHCH